MRSFQRSTRFSDKCKPDLPKINYCPHNIEARAKSEDAFERLADYISLRTDGTAFARLPLNLEALDGPDSISIDILYPFPR